MSEIPTSNEFISQIKGSDNENKLIFKLATVTSVSNEFPFIKFDGESSASSKKYSLLASYTPAINDRVLLAAVSGTYVILGKIKN